MVGQLVSPVSASGYFERTPAAKNLIRRVTGPIASVPILEPEANAFIEGIESQARQQVAASVMAALDDFPIDDDYWDEHFDELWDAVLDAMTEAVS